MSLELQLTRRGLVQMVSAIVATASSRLVVRSSDYSTLPLEAWHFPTPCGEPPRPQPRRRQPAVPNGLNVGLSPMALS